MVSPLGRLVEIAEDGRHLGKDRGFLTVSSSGAEIGRVPLDDLGGVIVTGHGTTLSLNVAAALAERGISLVLCCPNFVPSALLWPVIGHHAQQRHMEAQITSSARLAPELWAQLVAAKLLQQGAVLAELGQPARPFHRLAHVVRPGDPDNREAQGARRYWPLIFGANFRRDQDGPWPNTALNYGYAVLRAAAARAVCGAGLHPSIGLFHRHPHGGMPLADDLMEPFRPMVDLEVWRLVNEGADTVTPTVKKRLVGVLTQDMATAAGRSPVATCILRLAQSLAACFLMGGKLNLPHVDPPRSDADEQDK